MTTDIAERISVAETGSITLRQIRTSIYDGRLLIITLTLVFTLLALIYALQSPGKYYADALLQLEPAQRHVFLTAEQQRLPGSRAVNAVEMTLLKSRRVIGATVDELNLQTELIPNRVPVIGKLRSLLMGEQSGSVIIGQLVLDNPHADKPEPLTLTVIDPRHVALHYGQRVLIAETGQRVEQAGVRILVNAINAPPGSEFIVRYFTRQAVIERIRRNLTLTSPARESDLIKLRLSGTSPKGTVTLLASLIENYLLFKSTEQKTSSRNSLAWLADQLPGLRERLEQKEEQLKRARKQTGIVHLSHQAKSLLGQTVAVADQLNQLALQEAELTHRYALQHPAYQALIQKRQVLQKQQAGLNTRIAELPSSQQQIVDLTREVDSQRTLYLTLLTRQHQLNLLQAAAVSNVRILNAPMNISDETPWQFALTLLQGMLAGLLLALNIIFFRLSTRKVPKLPVNNIVDNQRSAVSGKKT